MKTVKTMLAILAWSAATFGAGAASSQTLTNLPLNQPAPTGATVLTFDSGLPNGFSLRGGKIVEGSQGGYSSPAGTTNKYLMVDGSEAVLSSNTGYRGVSLFWGSVDTFNTLEILDKAGSLIKRLTGSEIAPVTPQPWDWTSSLVNRYVSYTLDPATGREIGGLRFISDGTAFEVDDIAFFNPGGAGNPVSVPEPASLTLFGLGLAGLAAASRRRRQGKVAA